uniref:3-beta hydroxysteroid dehydrogenase/isomerase domain-containing protein n=1 Tax=Nelumbo nucifera TaxID=4432 RepID=A0A822XY30_NELNU|nr:TPA_asm: hypothetical protein HUJ06_026681 [Nelumbo nucifera]
MATVEDSVDEALETCVVLGGRSFIGRSLVLKLLESKKWIVRIADSAPSLHLDLNEQSSVLSEAISTGRASYFQVDVREKTQIVRGESSMQLTVFGVHTVLFSLLGSVIVVFTN